MADKLYINGCKQIKVTCKKNGEADRVFDFSRHFAKLTETYQRKTTVFEWDDGSKSKISHHVNYRWSISHVNEIIAPDLLNYGEIENLEIAGWEIYLQVHLDNGSRKFKALIIDEERDIDTESYFDLYDDTTNKGFEIAFTNAEPILNINMTNMTTYAENIGGTHEAPAKGQVQ